MKAPVRTLLPLIAVTAALAAPAAFAGPKCTDAPRSEWMPEKTMQDRITKAGYTIDKFKVSGTCYEIYGKDKTGRRVEIYYDPTDGSVVKERDDD
ncbi:PepSY domain-containing protein [Aerolutibacter ruishenii]|uniref:YpeB-like protein with putative protease inhibitory function n=1 Tax=Aerolutibacter ruishenii TaxID=686800 RepID=A0A562LXX9_9GAMM|nr:PepSY domain-containing protein [Lysobacter ruishenii]TWI12505.1 YpeB-like protein with putative protease inhibitory function [Lysobacter ruishenii]